MPNRSYILSLALACTVLLSACSPQADKQNKIVSEVQISPELSVIYKQYCKTCHENQASGAPLTGDKEKWHEVLNKGMETTLDHAMNGYKGMPAFGQCFECSPEQIEALITYMSKAKSIINKAKP